MQEDHVSMGWSAARKLRRSVDGLARVLAVELLTAARGVELRAPLGPGPASGAVIAALRDGAGGGSGVGGGFAVGGGHGVGGGSGVGGPGPDRFLAPDI